MNAATGEEEFRLPDPGNRDLPLLSLAFSPDGRRIIAGYGRFNRSQVVGHAKLWDLTSRKLIERIPGNRGTVYSVAFSPDGREVALASEGLVELWDLEATPRPIRSLPGHSGFVYAVAFSPDGRYLASGGLDRDPPALGSRHGQRDPGLLRARGLRPRPGVQPRRPMAPLGQRGQ